MPQLTRKQAILAKIESTYGTDSSPTGSANAILVKNMSIQPIAANVVGRDLIRPYMGEFDQLLANVHVECQFEVEMVGSGTAGTAPGYGPLLRACALSETLNASAVTGSAQAGSTTSVTLAAGASSTDNIYVGLPISITSGTGSGQTKTISAYNGTTKVATIAGTWTAPAASSGYSIAAGAVYKPISSSFESVTIYYNVDGVQHKITGCRGNVSAKITANEIPTYTFNLMGIYNGPTDTALPTVSYSGFMSPLVANNTNTSGFTFFDVSSFVLQNISLNANNTVNYRSLIGSEYVQIADRRTSGEASMEAVALSTFNAFSTAIGTTTGTMSVTHGTATGYKVKLDAYKVDVAQPSYEDNNGVNMLRIPFVALPNTGNDEFSITIF